MPADVIDLISSPEVEPQSTPAANNKSSSRVPPSAKKTIPHDDLDYDIFDLTADDIPPISTPNRLAREEPRLGTLDLNGDSQELKSNKSSARSITQKETSILDIDMSWLSSDGFPDIDNISKPTTGGDRTSEPARKRQRLSPPVSKSDSPKARLAQTHVPAITKSPARPGPSRRSSSRAIEDVEFSSSPHISSSKIPLSKPPAPKPTFRDDDDDSDPFASPPPRPTREEKGKGPAPASASASAKVTPEVTVIDDSDDDPFADPPPRMNPKPREPSRAPTTAAAWDPISSSAPLPAKSSPRRPLGRSQSNVIALDDSGEDGVTDPLSDDDDDDDFPDISDLRFPASRTTTGDLSGPTKRTFTKSASTTTGSTRPKPAAGGARKTAEERAREREDKALEKKAAAERKKREKERERQQKAEEKQRAAARAEANKLKTRKETATPEMIVDLPSSLDQAARIKAEEFLKKVDVKEVTTWTSPVDNVVRWRRVVKARYDEERHHYDPIPETTETEKFSLVILPAAEFAKLAMGAEGHNLEAHVLKMQRHFPGHRTIYLIEGLKQLLAKSRNKRNNEFASEVRSRLAAEDASASASAPARRAKKNDPPLQINEIQIDTALLQLQLLHSLQIYHTTCAQETATQLQLFTQQLAVAPYKTRLEDYLMKSAGFCMDSGQVRTGIDPKDIYVRTLQEVARITAPIAMGIANEYPSVGRLVNALERGGPGTLEDVRRVINKEGEVGEKRVGKAVSKRLWKIFTGRDEMSTEV
ncbi:ERCC4 domain-containing protein [Pseudoneurospora amorphoporcata]|uniref:ERCC4 domain-containing protein n=1 Tax=Pseudoneurospora amorphoporcata TaxID=241081 RepID=A0AAN6SJF9_9PEZI|nr:ERCC4 domain-containing protein [Pseudoneurospora amorphoporcata]